VSRDSFETGLHYPIKLGDLPTSWSYGYVGAFAELIESGFACGQHNQAGEGIQHLRPMNIVSRGHIDLNDARHVPAGFNTKRLEENDVLFNNTNSPTLVGKTACVGPTAAGKAFSNHMTRVVFGGAVEPRFAARQLNFLFSSGYFLHRCVKHVNQASISSSELGRTVPLVVPPINEQQRIVAKIEELFSELDAGEESLRRARRQLGVYRQSLLKQAFEGKLTATWRAKHPESGGAESWTGVEVFEVLTAKPNNGRSVKDRKGGFRVLRLTAIKDGVIDLNEHKEGDWNASEAATWVVKEGDFLASRGNGSIKLVGRGGIVRENADVAYPDTMIRLPLDLSRVLPRYFSFLWNSNRVRRQIEGSARTTAGIYKINQSLLSRYRLPLCSLPEQQEIVRLLDEQFEVIAQNEREIDAALKRSEALRQSILKKAFTGQLVPQDPADEPASVLLERIRAERESEQVSPKRKRAT
jgi:type I restriction enzyme S subunit